MMTREENIVYDGMIEFGVATIEELSLARNLVSGSWMEVLNSVLYIRTGYRTFEQFFECEFEDEDF